MLIFHCSLVTSVGGGGASAGGGGEAGGRGAEGDDSATQGEAATGTGPRLVGEVSNILCLSLPPSGKLHS